MSVWSAIEDPLRGRTSLAKVFWLYGILGSIPVSAIGLVLDSSNPSVMRGYTAFGLLFTVYVTVATYRCAGNCHSKAVAWLARISAVISLAALPVFAYLEFTGALDRAFTSLGGEL
jgi:ABC-type multidrug transport system permease subunit